jgi:esterase
MGVALASQDYGAGPPVLILHGLFGSAGNWAAVARRLGERFRVFALDLRNHSASPWAERMDYPAMAADVAGFMAARGLRSAAIIGHSMGGKVGMVLALTAPQSVDRLVTVDIAPVAREATHAASVEAMRSLDLRGVSRRAAADALLKPRIGDDAVRMFLLQNLVPGPDGLRWRINLDVILKEMGALSGFPEFPPGTKYPGPVLVVRGALSDYIVQSDLSAYGALFPAYRLVTIAGAGHWVHAEQPAPFIDAIVPFLAGES